MAEAPRMTWRERALQAEATVESYVIETDERIKLLRDRIAFLERLEGAIGQWGREQIRRADLCPSSK